MSIGLKKHRRARVGNCFVIPNENKESNNREARRKKEREAKKDKPNG